MTELGKYEFFTCSRETYKTDGYSFDGPSLLIAGNGDVGHIKFFDGKFDAYQRTYVLQEFSENIAFVKTCLEFHLPKRIHSELNVGAMPYIVLGTLKDMELHLPIKEEQETIASFFQELDKKLGNITIQLKAAKTFKKGLLQQMFV
jgi:type I restriction enzyme S subunit